MEYFRQRFRDHLNENWPVTIDAMQFDTADVFEKMAQDDFEASFSEWAQSERQLCGERATEFLAETGCLERFEALLERFEAKQVIPFVGAGMSVTSGFPSWGDFLRSLLTDAPDRKAEVEALICGGLYEEAAQLVFDAIGQRVFDEEIRNRLGNRRKQPAGPVRLLPHLFSGEVLTTNLDYVLTKVFESAQSSFNAEIAGPALREALVRLGADPHCLLRIHGEAVSNNGRVVTFYEYNRAYHDEKTLAAILGEICGPRSILFLGCSLTSDRTLQALKEINAKSDIARPPHYAFLPLSPNADRATRRRDLAEAGIHPIYYPDGDHDQCIEDLLISLMEGGQ